MNSGERYLELTACRQGSSIRAQWNLLPVGCSIHIGVYTHTHTHTHTQTHTAFNTSPLTHNAWWIAQEKLILCVCSLCKGKEQNRNENNNSGNQGSILNKHVLNIYCNAWVMVVAVHHHSGKTGGDFLDFLGSPLLNLFLNMPVRQHLYNTSFPGGITSFFIILELFFCP